MVDNSRSKSRIVAVANQKGGVGKTTTTLNLAAALAASGRKILVIDLDPQGSASTGVGIQRSDRTPGSHGLFEGDIAAARCVRPTQIPNLFFIPSNSGLAGAEIELVDVSGREIRLKAAVQTLSDYDLTFIDCPPSLGLLTLNGLVAAESVLIPLQCEFFALEGLSQLVQTIDRVRDSLNSSIELDGIVLTMFDRRNNLSSLVAADARGFFGNRVYKTVIPRNVRVSEAPSHGLPVILYDPRSSGALAYSELAAEFVQRSEARFEAAL